MNRGRVDDRRDLVGVRDARRAQDAADITREEYVGRSRALKASLEGGRPQPTYSEAVLVRAARLLAELGDLWKGATPQERQEIAGNLFAEVRVRWGARSRADCRMCLL